MRAPRGARHAGDALHHRPHHGPGYGRGLRPGHRRRFSSATHGPCIGHISPEAAAGGPIALVEDGDEIFIDIAARRLELKVSPEELERRRAVWKPLVKPRGPALAKYAAHVSSADRGAIIELENSACQ